MTLRDQEREGGTLPLDAGSPVDPELLVRGFGPGVDSSLFQFREKPSGTSSPLRHSEDPVLFYKRRRNVRTR